METRLEAAFAGGRFTFWLPMPRVVEIERGPQGHRHDKRYPVSIFQLYDELGAGLGLNGDTPVYLGGGRSIVSDARNVVLQGLIGGGKGMIDGAEVEVGAMRASEMIDAYAYPHRPAVEIVHLAWSILHAAINGVVLKKKEPETDPANPKRSAKGKSSRTAVS